MKIKFKHDRYQKNRGGYTRLLDICCESCGSHLFYYQKDGPGLLKRLYLDRIFESVKYSGLHNISFKKLPNLICPGCKQILGVPYIYPKEHRLSFRLFAGAISKKVVKN